ncbi:hypothetical protein BH11BAC3_BH11BAC3_19690 [soil metagenome]
MSIFWRYNLMFIAIALSLPVKSQTVFKTPSGQKYHLASCRMVKNVSKEITLAEAKDLGLLPCKICNPQNVQVGEAVVHKAKGENKTVRCNGYTKAGTRCKHMTSIANGYCYQHQPE